MAPNNNNNNILSMEQVVSLRYQSHHSNNNNNNSKQDLHGVVQHKQQQQQHHHHHPSQTTTPRSSSILMMMEEQQQQQPDSPTNTTTNSDELGSYYSTPTTTFQYHHQNHHEDEEEEDKMIKRKKKSFGSKLPRSSCRRQRRPPRPERSKEHSPSRHSTMRAASSESEAVAASDLHSHHHPHPDSQKKVVARRVSSSHSDHEQKAFQDSAAAAAAAASSSCCSLYPSTGLDRNAILERLQRLSCHLAESMVSTLLDQMDREEEHQHAQQHARNNNSNNSNNNVVVVVAKSQQQSQSQSQSRMQLTEQEKLQLLQAQMAELERRSDHYHHQNDHDDLDDNEQMMRHFELELLDDFTTTTDPLLLDDDKVNDDDSSSESSSSSYISESSFHSSVYDIMPLAGEEEEEQEKDYHHKVTSTLTTTSSTAQQPQERQKNNPTLRDFLEKNNTNSNNNTNSEQLVTKIGQTRLNRTLRKSPSSVVGGGSAAGDNQSIVTNSEHDASSSLSQVSSSASSSHHHHNNMTTTTTPAVPRRRRHQNNNNNKFLSKRSVGSAPAELLGGGHHSSSDTNNYNKSLGGGAASSWLLPTSPSSFLEADDQVLCDSRKSAICLVDISGFTNLSRCLNVEDLSKTINQYFQRIVDLIHWHGGDVIKFAGDALIVEWKEVKKGGGGRHHRHRVTSWQAVLNAATCASRIVDSCCDFPVKDERSGQLVSTLNVHVGLGYGHVMACSVGDLQRREYLILGETIQQVADAMSQAQQGEVMASAEAYALLNETAFIVNPSVFDYDDGGDQPQIIACKKEQYFKPKVDNDHPFQGKTDPQELKLIHRIEDWSVPALERLLARMSSYVHPAVLTQEMDGNNNNNSNRNTDSSSLVAATAQMARRRNSNDSQKVTAVAAADAELREVFTTFIQPDVDVRQIMGPEVNLETVELLQKIMLIVNSEVTRFKGQLRQFIVDDKGLVIIANFGLRGSTFPNMVEERGLPCISNIKKLIKTELELNCRVGATFGKVYCGIVGASNRHEYAILGSPVNLAARLMSTKDNNGILVDEAVKMKASHQPFESLEPVKAKGYDQPVKIFRPHESIRKSWKSLSSNFVGRNDEMGSIAQSAKNILKSKSHAEMMFLTGGYGVGKSLVLAHALNRVTRACSQALKTCYTSTHVFCDEDSFKPFSILRPLFLDLMKGRQGTTININLPTRNKASGSVRGSSRQSSSVASDSRSGSFKVGSSHRTVSNFSLGENDSVKSCSTDGFTDDLFNDEENAGGNVDEKMLNLELLKICLECGIPMNYVEVFGGLIFTNKLSDIGSWADRGQKQSEWDQIARYIVKAFLHVTAKYDLVVLALDEVCGMDEMSWKIIELLYHQSKNLMILCSARSQFDINIPEEFWEALTAPDTNYFTHRVLPNMESRETMQLVHKKLDRKMGDLHERDLQRIAKTVHILSNGNPLMATEILNKLYLKFTPAEEENLENLGYIGELLMNRLDSLSANVLNHLNLGALLGSSFYLDEVVTVMARYNDVSDDGMAAHSVKVEAALKVAVDNGILFISTTSSSVYFFNQQGAGRPFDLDELVDERMKNFNIPLEERENNANLVWEILEQRVQAGVLRKETFQRTTYTFSHEFWQKSISWRTLESWKNEMLKIKAELDAMKRAARSSLMG